MAKPKQQRDHTSFLFALILHAVLILGVTFWAWKTGKLERARQAVLQYVRGEKREQQNESKPVHQKAAEQPKLPPINQGVAPASGGGVRRAVAADAPPPAGGESFFRDTRPQVQGSSTGGADTLAQTRAVRGQTAASTSTGPVRPAFAPPQKSSISVTLAERAKAATAMESVGAEQMSRSGASDAAAAVAKVAGATIVEGKFAVIRGLSDRYVSTTLNGAEIPSADPYRRSASLDMFPAQIVDRIVVSKTFTPDQQGAFTGGGIDVVTKSFPDRAFATAAFGLGYNSQTTGNDRYLDYRGGQLDWLGIDDGSRALPASVSAAKIPQPVFSTGRPTSPTYSQRVAQANLLNDLTRAMGTAQFAPTEKTAPPDHNFSVAAGDTAYFLERPFGVFGSISYRRDFRYLEGLSQRFAPSGAEIIRAQEFRDRLATDTVNWSGIATVASQWADGHELDFCFLRNQNALKSARSQIGTRESEPGRTFYTHRLIWVERALQSFQFKGKDEFPELGGARLDWLIATTDTSQYEPDTRFFNMAEEAGVYVTGRNYLPDPQDPTRYFRTLDEKNLNPKVDLTLPFRIWAADEATLKAGWFLSTSDRSFSERQIYYRGDAPFNRDPNSYLTTNNLGYVARPGPGGSILYTWNRYISSFDTEYTAASDISATYLMLELPVAGRLKLIGGARIETTDLQVNSLSYIENAVTGQRTNVTMLNQTDVLPAIGLVYSLGSNMNLRLHYSRTIARPSFRELAAYRSYDPVLDVELDGNPLLTMASADNYDLRWEWFMRPGELLSLSLFHKRLQNPIERKFISMVGDLITFENRQEGEVSGIEIEWRKRLDCIDARLRNWSIGGNLALIRSETPLTPTEFANKSQIVPDTDPTRPLYDQSPYILNLDLNYDNPAWGTAVSLVYNLTGPRIAIASLTTEDIYEQPAPTLDLIISQKLGLRSSLKLTAKNILNPEFKRTYGKDGDRVFSSFRRGVTVGLQLSCEF